MAPTITTATLFDTTNPSSPVDVPWVDGPKVLDGGTLSLAMGAWHSGDTILITHRGILPGAGNLPTQDSDGLVFPTAGSDLGDRIRPGDQVEVASRAGGCTLTVDTVNASGVAVAPAGGLPGACAGRTSFSVRAEGAQPDVVASVDYGFVLRCGPNQTCESHNQPYFHRPRYYDPLQPTIHIEFGADQLADGGEVGQDWVWSLSQINGHFSSYLVGIDPTSVGCGTQLAGAAVFDAAHERTFVAFPSANGVMEVDQTSTVQGPNTGASVCYR